MEPPSGGDERFLPDEYNERTALASRDHQRNAGGRSAGGSRAADGFDPVEVLAKMLYSPPIPMEPFCAKLAVSSVSVSPRIAMGAFLKRYAR